MSKYQEPKEIINARKRIEVINKILVEYKKFYRRRLNDQLWANTAISRTYEYYKAKAEINLLYIILQQHNKLKKAHAKLNPKHIKAGGC